MDAIVLRSYRSCDVMLKNSVRTRGTGGVCNKMQADIEIVRASSLGDYRICCASINNMLVLGVIDPDINLRLACSSSNLGVILPNRWGAANIQ